MAASPLVARSGANRRREIAVHITSVECILTAPAGVGLAVVKVTTSEPGLYGLGCATFTQRLLAVRTVVDEYHAPQRAVSYTHLRAHETQEVIAYAGCGV